MFDAIEAPTDDLIDVYGEYREGDIETYSDFASNFVSISPIAEPNPQGAAKGWIWDAGEFWMDDIEFAPMAFWVEKQHVKHSGHLAQMQRVVFGLERGVEEDDVFTLQPNEITLSSQAPNRGVWTRIRIQELQFPKRLLDLDPDSFFSDIKVRPSSVLGKIIFGEWESLFQHLHRNGRHLSRESLDRFIACLKIALGTPAQREDVRAQARDALYREICRCVERNLGDPDLTASSILRDFGVSRAGLYRMFEPQGGVRHYITERRAIRAVLELFKGVQTRGAVQAAADRWGFSTGPNFNRVIKRMFGASPGALFQSVPRISQPPRGDQELLSNYLATTAAA